MKIVLSVLIVLLFLSPAAAETTPGESVKIATFCKLWGFLKYYHPVVAKGNIDWDQQFMTRVKVVASITSKQAINSYYLDWIKSLGKVDKCKKCDNNIPDSLKFNLDLGWLNDSIAFTSDLISELQFIQQNRNQGKNYYVQQFAAVGNTNYENEKPYTDSIFPSVELRLLGLSRYWNIINYFFPYKYKIGQNWNEVLIEMIPKFKDSKDTVAYHLAILELTAKLHDSHASFVTTYTNQFFGFKWAPFRFKIIDNKAIVTGCYNDSLCRINDIRYGDVFLSVGDQSIKDIIAEKSKYIGASNYPTMLRNFYYAIFNGQTDSVTATVDRDGIAMTKTIYRYNFENLNFKWTDHNAKDTCKILEGNIGYLNLGLLQPSQTDHYLHKLKDTKAIIFDVRNYPNGTMYGIANFLNSGNRPFVKFTKPDMSYPGLFQYTRSISCGRKNDSPYAGKVVLLFNEATQSHAEFTLMALQTAPNVISIGSQTAGADGNVSLITFPGNYKTYMTGIGVYYPDGRETQRIGIVPDIEVKPTVEGLRLGKDELLEKATEVIIRL